MLVVQIYFICHFLTQNIMGKNCVICMLSTLPKVHIWPRKSSWDIKGETMFLGARVEKEKKKQASKKEQKEGKKEEVVQEKKRCP